MGAGQRLGLDSPGVAGGARPVKTEQYYLDRALKMEHLAKEAATDVQREGYFKAAEAYYALAKSAGALDADLPEPGLE